MQNMTLPDMHAAEPIPDEARSEIDRLLASGDLFRYTAAKDAPVSLLEAEFAGMMGSKFALAVSSCSARHGELRKTTVTAMAQKATKKDSRYLPTWIGLVLMGREGRLIRKSEFEKCYRERERDGLPEVDHCWRDLLRFGRSRRRIGR